jgi:hypothetical protein
MTLGSIRSCQQWLASSGLSSATLTWCSLSSIGRRESGAIRLAAGSFHPRTRAQEHEHGAPGFHPGEQMHQDRQLVLANAIFNCTLARTAGKSQMPVLQRVSHRLNVCNSLHRRLPPGLRLDCVAWLRPASRPAPLHSAGFWLLQLWLRPPAPHGHSAVPHMKTQYPALLRYKPRRHYSAKRWPPQQHGR